MHLQGAARGDTVFSADVTSGLLQSFTLTASGLCATPQGQLCVQARPPLKLGLIHLVMFPDTLESPSTGSSAESGGAGSPRTARGPQLPQSRRPSAGRLSLRQGGPPLWPPVLAESPHSRQQIRQEQEQGRACGCPCSHLLMPASEEGVATTVSQYICIQ